MTIFTVLSLWQSSLGSCDECRLGAKWLSALRPCQLTGTVSLRLCKPRQLVSTQNCQWLRCVAVCYQFNLNVSTASGWQSVPPLHSLSHVVCRGWLLLFGAEWRKTFPCTTTVLSNHSQSLRRVARGFDWFYWTPQPPAVGLHVYSNCCGPSSKLPNNSVKIQLNLHQIEPFQVKKSQYFLGRGHSPSPETPQ